METHLQKCRSPQTARDYCLRELARFHGECPRSRAFLVVPEEAKADMGRLYLEHYDPSGLMMAEVLSFRRLCYRLFSEAGGLAVNRLDENGKLLLLGRILQEKKDEYPCLGRMASKGGCLQEISLVLGDFARYGVEDELLRSLAEDERIPLLSREKYDELSRLEKASRDFMKEQALFDSDEDFPRLVKLLEENPPALQFLEDSFILVCGMDLLRAYTPQEMKLLKALSERAGRLEIVTAGDPELEVTESVLFQMKKELSLLPEALPEEEKEEPELQLWASRDAREEARACAGTIRRLLLDGDFRRREIAVACCDSKNEELLAELFREYGIDPSSSAPKPLDESPLLRYMESFFTLAAGHGRPMDLVSLGHSGLVTKDFDGLDEFENVLLARGTRWIQDLEKPEAFKGAPEAERFYLEALKPHLEAAREFRSLRKGAEKAVFLLKFLDEKIREVLQAEIDICFKNEREEIAELFSRSWELLISLLEDSRDLFGDMQICAQDFGELVLSSLRGNTPRSIPLGIDRVRVARPEQLLLYPAKCLFILGMTEETFPGALPSEGFLQSQERQWIRAPKEEDGESFPDSRRDQIPKGEALSSILLSLPEERLILSVPSMDESVAPAIWREKKKEVPEEAFTVFNDPLHMDERWFSFSRARALIGASKNPPAAWKTLLGKAEEIEDPLNDPLPKLFLPADLFLASLPGHLSVSQLQAYNDCPYRYFLDSGVGVRERPVFQPDPAVEGSFMHLMLELSLQDLIQEGRENAALWRAKLNGDYVKELYRRAALAEDGRYLDLRLAGGEGRFVRKKLLEVLQQNAGEIGGEYFPCQLEASLERFPEPYKIGGRPLVGFIDRVDFSSSRDVVRLIDYKSSDKIIRLRDILAGRQIQLPLYAKAWETLQGQTVEQVALYSLKGSGVKNVLDDSEKKRLSVLPTDKELADDKTLKPYADYASAVAGRIFERMKSGEISPRPLAGGQNSPCDHCQYQAVCRLDERLKKQRERSLAFEENAPSRGKDKYFEKLLETWDGDRSQFPEGV